MNFNHTDLHPATRPLGTPERTAAAKELADMQPPRTLGTAPLGADEELVNSLIAEFGEDVVKSKEVITWLNVNDPVTRDDIGAVTSLDTPIPEVTPTEDEIQAQLELMIELENQRIKQAELDAKKLAAVNTIKAKLSEKQQEFQAKWELNRQVETHARQRADNAKEKAKALYKAMKQDEEKQAQEAAQRLEDEKKLAALDEERKTLLQRVGLKK